MVLEGERVSSSPLFGPEETNNSPIIDIITPVLEATEFRNLWVLVGACVWEWVLIMWQIFALLAFSPYL